MTDERIYQGDSDAEVKAGRAADREYPCSYCRAGVSQPCNGLTAPVQHFARVANRLALDGMYPAQRHEALAELFAATAPGGEA